MSGGGGHIRILDTLRGLAALAVFTSHYVQQFLRPDLMGWAGHVLELLGVWGVGVFFVLSGFVIHGGTLLAPPDWAHYRRRRFFRIVPAYIMALIACWLVGRSTRSYLIFPADFADFLTHLFFVSSVVPDHFNNINAVMWTVVVECHFYIVYPLLRPLLMRIGATRFVLISMATGGVSFLLFSAAVPSGPARDMMQHLAPVLFWKWALGVLLAEMFHLETFPALRRLFAQGRLLPIFFAGAFLGSVLPSNVLRLNYERFVLPLFCFALVGVLLFSPARRFRTALGEHLGDISYSIYLWHPLGLLAALDLVGASPLLALVVALIGSLGLAEISYHVIETPFRRLPGWLQDARDRRFSDA